MKHGSEAFRKLAEDGTILRAQVGSGVHGISISDQDDRDEMGICLEPPEYVMGLQRFEQYEYRSAGQGNRSGPGDLDLIVYSARKWMRLALQGNPTIILLMFVPDHEIVQITDAGRDLRAHAGMVVSRQAGRRFMGYLHAQRERLLGLRSNSDTNRKELIEAYGYDVKFAGHMVRLGIQGVEMLETGKITLPMPEPHRTWIKELRVGKHTKIEALNLAAEYEAKLMSLMLSSSLPEHPDYAAADRWLVAAHQKFWLQDQSERV